MWFGTLDGLNRYDGHGFTLFRYDPPDKGDSTERAVSYRDQPTGQEGTGIGLALAKEIVELHYGEIHVESEGEPSGERPFEPVGTETGADDRDIILIVEDNGDLRAFIRQHLESDYKVLEAVDGADGVEKAITSIPDLIISDVMMPGTNFSTSKCPAS